MLSRSSCMYAQFQSTPPVKAATKRLFLQVPPLRFQSTPPVKAATNSVANSSVFNTISIHAAREGGDGDFMFLAVI